MMETIQKEKSKTHLKDRKVCLSSSVGRLNQWSQIFEKSRLNLRSGNVK